MFGKFGSLLSFRGHFIGRHGATRKRHNPQSQQWQVSGEELETRTLLTLVAGTDVNVTQLAGSQSQMFLAVNPTNPLNMIATVNTGVTDPLLYSNYLEYTVDGGKNWVQHSITASDDGIFTLGGTSRYDLTVAFDSFGNAHLTYIVKDFTTSTTIPAPRSAAIYCVSADGGQSFSNFRVLEQLNANVVDRPAIATGPDASNPNRNVVLVTYGRGSSMLATAAPVNGLGSIGSFTNPVTFAPFAESASPAVGPTGVFSIAWSNNLGTSEGPTSIQVTRDANGLQGGITFGAGVSVTATNAGELDTIPAVPDFKARSQPQLAYDTSNGPHSGRLYIAYADETPNESNDFDVYVRFSDNNGQTWSNRVKVNDDTTTNSQFMQSISVDPVTGGVFVGWYDARNDKGDGAGADTDMTVNTDVEYYGTVSTDGGTTFQPNVKISDGSSNQVRDIGNLIDFDDTTAVAAYGGIAYAMWGDNSNSTGNNPDGKVKLDAYFDTIVFNNAPTLAFTPDIATTGVVIDEDTSTGPLPFTVADDNTPAGSLIVTATSSNPAIIPNSSLVLGGAGATRTISATPVANASGTVVITVTVSDGLLTFSKSFKLRVDPQPDPLPIPPDSTVSTSAFSDSTVTPITDNGQITSVITVSTPDTYLYDANVTINIDHTRNSDLRVELISPRGTHVVLTSNNGGDFDNGFTGTLFDDQAVTAPVTDFPFTDNVTTAYVVPEGALAQLLGEDPNGDWTLQIDDQVAGETGNLNGWQLDFTTLSSAPLLQPNFGINGSTQPLQDAKLVNGQIVNGVTTSVINLNGLDSFTYDLNLSLDLSHSNSGDLDIYLVSPSGTEVPISTGNGSSLDDIYRSTTFDDQAAIPVTDVMYANGTSLGIVIPESALAGFVGENPNGNWTLKIVDRAPGGTGTLNSWSLNVTTVFVNDAPTIGAINNPGAVPEDSGPQTLTLNNISAGGGESQPLKVTAVSSNPTLVPNPTVDYQTPSPNATLTYTPAPDQFGISVISVTVEDGGYDQDLSTTADNGITVRNFTVVVNPVNDPPTVDPIADPPAILEDAGPQQLTLTGIGAGGGENQVLQITATSNLPGGLLDPTVEYLQGSSIAILHYQSNPDYNGLFTITLQLTDGGLDNNLATTGDNQTTTRTFHVEVTVVNDPPTLDPINNPTPLSEDSPTQTIGLSGISPGGHETQNLRVTATSGNPAVVPDVSVHYADPNSVASLSFRPAPNAFGTAVITVTVEDGGADGFLDTTGDNETFQRQFTVTILQVNDPPVFNSLSLAPLMEDAGPQSVDLKGISSGPLESQPLVFSVTSSNPALVANPTISYASPATTGTLQFDVTPNTSGGSTLTVTLMDGGIDNDLSTLADNETFTRTLVVSVLPVNDPPTLDDIADPGILLEDSAVQTISLTGISAGGNENQPITVVATSSLPSIIPNPTITYTPGDTTGTLQFTPNPDEYGTVTISVTITDGGLDGNLATLGDNGATTKTFTVDVEAVNDAPHFDQINNPAAILEDSGPQAIQIEGVTAGANESQQLHFTAVSSNSAVLPDPFIGFVQGTSNANLTFETAPGQNGTATVTVTVIDPGLDGDFNTLGDNLSYSQDFVVTILPINDPPTLGAIASPSPILEDAGLQTINLTGMSSGDSGQNFVISATSSNPTLIPDANLVINHAGNSATGTLAYTAVADQSGTATITVKITDSGADGDFNTIGDNLVVTRTFTVEVQAVNDPPTLASLGGTFDLTEGAGHQVINLTGISAGGGESQPVAITVQSSNTNLIANAAINYNDPSSTGQLTFTPLANANGTATLHIRVEDGGLDHDLATTADNVFITQDLIVNVEDVNDAPTINPVQTPQLINEDSAPTTVTLTGISGGLGENQTVQISAVSDNPDVVPNPTIVYGGQATATLTYTPVANQYGTANIVITVRDSGGLETTRLLTVVVAPVNDLPTINSLGGPVTIDEDAPQQTVNLSGISAGPNEAEQVFNVTVISSRPDIIPTPSLIYTPGSPTGQITYQALPDQNGQVLLTVKIVDGGADNNLSTTADNAERLVTLTVNVTPEPEVPVLTIDQGMLTTSNGHPVYIAPGAVVTDADSPNFKNGNLKVQITGDAQSGDILRLRPSGKGADRIRATRNGLLKHGKTVIGNVTGGRGAVPLVITFSQDTTQEQVEQIARHIQYRGQSAQTGLRTLEATVTDDTGLTSDVASRDIALT